MGHTVVTMTRGDGAKIEEWIDYHSRLGFDDFQIVLDGDIDGTATILQSLDVDANLTLHPREETDEYFDGLDAHERRARIEAWRERHAAQLATGAMRGQDQLAWRQYLHFPEVLTPYAAGQRGKGWLALLDVDEFIVLTSDRSIQEITRGVSVPRLRFLNFDVDTTGHDPDLPVLGQHTMRWDRDDILSHPDDRWARRVKSLVRYKCANLEATVHKISRGRQKVLDPCRARLHHFRMPTHEDLGIPYTVDDPVRLPPSR